MGRRVRATSISLFLILLGIVGNERAIETSLVPDGSIESPIFRILIMLCQTVLVLAGVVVFLRRRRIRTPLRGELALLACSLLVTALAAEGAARIWLRHFADPDQTRKYALFEDIEPERFQYAPHQYLGYTTSPNYRRGMTFHNSLGFRNDELSRKKPSGAFRIVALGGSTTYTHKVENNAKTFTEQLERILREPTDRQALRDRHRLPGRHRLEVINAGVGGYTSWESLINLELRVVDLEPDLVIVYHGTNDVKARFVDPASYAADNSGRRKPWSTPPVHPAERSCLWRILLRRVGAAQQVHLGDFVNKPLYLGEEDGLTPSEVLAANPPIYSRRNLESMIAVARFHGIEIVLMTWAYSPRFGDDCATEHFQRGFAEHNAMVREVAARHGVPCFDFVREMPQAREFWADGRHVNERGALEKARLVAGFLRARKLVPTPEVQ